jgi:SHS family lactate transporter-like MFS transporter
MACILGGLVIYPYFFVSGAGLCAAVFFEQFMIQGIFGIVPIHLIELSPPAFRTFVVGTAYNLGVAFASPIPVIDTKIGETFPIGDTQRFDYSIGMAIFLGCAFAYLIVVTFWV